MGWNQGSSSREVHDIRVRVIGVLGSTDWSLFSVIIRHLHYGLILLTQNKIYFLEMKSGKWCTFYSYRGLGYIIVNYFYYYYSADVKLVINYNTTHNAQRAWYCSCTYIRFISHLQKDDVLLINRYIRNQKNSVTKRNNIFLNR